MKKISLFLILIMILSLIGCSAQNQNEEQKPPKSAMRPAETKSEPSETEKSLEYGKNTYEQSIQVNQKDLPWAVYNEVPSDITVDHMIFLDDTQYAILTPTWGQFQFEKTYLLNNQPDYIMFTFGAVEGDYQTITIQKSVSWKDLVDWKENDSEELQIHEFDVKLSTGTCHVNNNARNEKFYVMANVKNEAGLFGCIIGITEDGAFHDINDIRQAVVAMCESITAVQIEDPLALENTQE